PAPRPSAGRVVRQRPGVPAPGDVVFLDGRASPQFGGDRALRLRVVSVCDKPTYDHWVWLTGYVLDQAGAATARREVFVLIAGIRVVSRRSEAQAVRAVRGRGV
ncbi:hypothetical protein, partial [Micromonospora echinofusca]|uniref:hypothetical protein n=1 Tax=Micromonospora echinofusca TaxID=47858 RepID=UPI001FCA79A4